MQQGLIDPALAEAAHDTMRFQGDVVAEVVDHGPHGNPSRDGSGGKTKARAAPGTGVTSETEI